MKFSFTFENVTNTQVLDPLKKEWRQTLVAPQDDMWESFTEQATHWAIQKEDQIIGYAAVNQENCLLQFFITPQWLPDSSMIFQDFLRQQQIKQAIIGTNNPIALSIAMHLQKGIHVHTYLFADMQKTNPAKATGTLRVAMTEDLEQLISFCQLSMGASEAWLRGYISNLIERSEFFLLEEGKEILGTCEVRQSESDPSVAAVGMVVSPKHRKKGVGTFLLGQAKRIALQWGKQPTCSCEKDNIGSLKAIHNNGFRSMHQMLLMEF